MFQTRHYVQQNVKLENKQNVRELITTLFHIYFNRGIWKVIFRDNRGVKICIFTVLTHKFETN